MGLSGAAEGLDERGDLVPAVPGSDCRCGEVAHEPGQVAADAALVGRGHDVLDRREVRVERRLIAVEVVARGPTAGGERACVPVTFTYRSWSTVAAK